MKIQLHRYFMILASISVLWLALPDLGQATPPAQGPPPDKAAAFGKLIRDSGREPVITWDQETGVPTFIRGTLPPSSIIQKNATGFDLARAFFNRYRGLFNMKNPSIELSLLESVEEAGRAHFRFQQMYLGLPVWGAQMLVYSQSGQLRAVNGHYQPDLELDPTPLITANQAEAIARDELGSRQASLEKDAELVIMTFRTEPTLTWLVRLYSEDPLGRWFYFINAGTGEVTYYYNSLPRAKDRDIYDAGGACFTFLLPGSLVATEATGGGLPSGAAKDAFDYVGNTYDYYDTFFGRDSYDDAGATIVTSVNYGSSGVCPSSAFNAFWNGVQFVFGAGGGSVSHYSKAEDVVAHEFTHAVTQYTADLIYQFEQGALNESISDIFGAFAQQHSSGDFNDWELGEDLGIVIRDMSNPSWYGQPEHMDNYNELGWLADNGGVHINSGIPNKAAYLMVVGGTFHGVTVTGIGVTKTEQIFYGALSNYLSPLSGFLDVRDSTIQACLDLIGSFGIIAANCDQVQNAWAAVGLSVPASLPALPYTVYLPTIIRDDAGAFIYEPNDDVTQAYGPLSSGVVYKAYLQTDGDVDIYHFTTGGGLIDISLDSLPVGTNYDLELFDSAGQLIDASYNPGSTADSISRVVPSGKYYIYISPTSSASSTTDSYRLVVTYP